LTLLAKNAIIKESLRLSHGAPGRLPRLVPPSGTFVNDIFIPRRTLITHSNYIYHSDENIFPHAHEFTPERWLGGDTRELEKNMLAFSRG
ncbi:MAG: hypothetical protein Q9226_009134, partial [Calogaya cf. arnoldii]